MNFTQRRAVRDTLRHRQPRAHVCQAGDAAVRVEERAHGRRQRSRRLGRELDNGRRRRSPVGAPRRVARLRARSADAAVAGIMLATQRGNKCLRSGGFARHACTHTSTCCHGLRKVASRWNVAEGV
eukprot:357762-Chlamydomonas_euryale.AAC.1